jgi:hypothetical protein
MSNSSRARWSVTTVSVLRPSISGNLRAATLAERDGHDIEHVAVAEDVRAADLELAGRGLDFGRQREISEHVIDADGLGLRLEPGWGDHRGKTLYEVPERSIGLAVASDDHRGAEVRQRRAVRFELFGGLVTAAQML